MKRSKILLILHQSPPLHGAAKVGDIIVSSKKMNNFYDCKFIKIKSSKKIEDIGKFNIYKFFLVISLYFRIFFMLAKFRPNKIYFTASISGAAFFRDLLLSFLWKFYCLINNAQVFYHYHTKGVDNFVSRSKVNLFLTNLFIRNVNVILLSKLLVKDFEKVNAYKKIFMLSNGIKTQINESSFENNIKRKYEELNQIHVLYLSQLIKEKGYDQVLELARHTSGRKIHYHFAGHWQSPNDEKYFFEFIKNNNLTHDVTYHGYVNGIMKDNLFNKAHLLAYPSRNDAFPLTILEALSFGVPVIAFNQGSIPLMLDERSGIIVKDLMNFIHGFEKSLTSLINENTAIYCRKRFSKNFTLEKFETNLIEIFHD